MNWGWITIKSVHYVGYKCCASICLSSDVLIKRCTLIQGTRELKGSVIPCRAESIEWFIVDQAFLLSYDSASCPPLPPLQAAYFEHTDGRGGWGVGEEPKHTKHTIARPWPSINHSKLAAAERMHSFTKEREKGIGVWDRVIKLCICRLQLIVNRSLVVILHSFDWWIRSRIRILNADSDPDPGVEDLKLQRKTSWKFTFSILFYFFW